MKITSMEEYGLRCMMQLSLADPGVPMTVAQVAENEGLSTEYAGKLLNLLRQAGLVDSVRGRNGGFVLTRRPNEISLAEVMRVFSPDLFDADSCQRYSGNEDNCVHNSACALRPVWWTLSEMITRTLEGLMLTDLMRSEPGVHEELRTKLETMDMPQAATAPDCGSPDRRLSQLQVRRTG